MVEPVTLTAAAIATLVITKAFEKTGEKLGEKVFEQGIKLAVLLRTKSPTIASAIELAQKQPSDYGQALLQPLQEAASAYPEVAEAVKQVEAAALTDPNFPQAVQKVEDAMKWQSTAVHKYGKLAEELPNLKAVFQGNIIHGDVNF